MLPSTRKGFYFNVAPGDNVLVAIGMVVVQWSALENLIKAFAHAFLKDNEAERADFDATLVTKRRIQMFRAIILSEVAGPYQKGMIEIVDRISQMQQERDRIVHGAWSDNGPFDFGSPRKPFFWNSSYGDVLKVAHKIDALMKDMTEYVFICQAETQDGILLSHALQKMRRTRDSRW